MAFKRKALAAILPYVGADTGITVGIPTANAAILYPVWLPAPQSFSRFRFGVSGAAAGLMDLGLYRADFSKVFTLGALAPPIRPPVVTEILFPSIGLAAGLWYIALVADGGMNFFGNASASYSTGDLLTKAAVGVPLPASLAGAANSNGIFAPSLVMAR